MVSVVEPAVAELAVAELVEASKHRNDHRKERYGKKSQWWLRQAQAPKQYKVLLVIKGKDFVFCIILVLSYLLIITSLLIDFIKTF